ncbi:hypothetical protein TNCV_2421951 [Trichonephila clavipes]|nr:hypothetical protein TNCV_2421951 [Trichonephila clavipes]
MPSISAILYVPTWIGSITTSFCKTFRYDFMNPSFEPYTGDSTIWLGSTPNIEEEHSGGGQRPPASLPLPLTSRENLQPDGYAPMPRRH